MRVGQGSEVGGQIGRKKLFRLHYPRAVAAEVAYREVSRRSEPIWGEAKKVQLESRVVRATHVTILTETFFLPTYCMLGPRVRIFVTMHLGG